MSKIQETNNRRDFLKKAGSATLAAGTVSLGSFFVNSAKPNDDKQTLERYWKKKRNYSAKCEQLKIYPKL